MICHCGRKEVRRVEKQPGVIIRIGQFGYDHPNSVIFGGFIGAKMSFLIGDTFFDKHEADILHDKIDELKEQNQTLTDARIPFSGAPEELKSDNEEYLQKRITANQTEIQSLTTEAREYTSLNNAESIAGGVLLGLGLTALFGIGYDRAKNAYYWHKEKRLVNKGY